MDLKPRVVFMGTPELACASLQALLDCPHLKIVGVATQPDRSKGRDLKLTASPVKALALERSLPLLQPEKARDPQFLEALRELRPDLICVAAFGQILPLAILELPRFGCLNVHTSLLPKYRGAAPIQWALLNGDTQTGVTIMKMDAGLDTGPILAQESTPRVFTTDSPRWEPGFWRARYLPTSSNALRHQLNQPLESATLAKSSSKTALWTGGNPHASFGIRSGGWFPGQEPSRACPPARADC